MQLGLLRSRGLGSNLDRVGAPVIVLWRHPMSWLQVETLNQDHAMHSRRAESATLYITFLLDISFPIQTWEFGAPLG